MTDIDKKEEQIIKHVTIPMYFNQIINPATNEAYTEEQISNMDKKSVLCPLHKEETPSFRYYKETNTFMCFGCNRGGNIIDLHIAYAKLKLGIQYTSKKVVVELLSRKFGVDIPE